MHPGRRSILVRWIAYVVVLVATASWLYANQRIDVPRPSGIEERLAPKQVDLPPEEVTATIREAIGALTQKIPNYGAVEKVDPSLVVIDPEALDEGKQQFAALSLSALFLGPPAKYAILNGVVYREGAALPDGRVLQAIDADGVTLARGEETERVSWLPPYRVELKKAAVQAGERPSGEAEAGAAPETQAEQAPAANLENLPPDLTPDQALQILQQVGQKQ